MKSILSIAVFASLVAVSALQAGDAPSKKGGALPYRLYAMDTGLRGPDMKSAVDRVVLLKKLGYQGIGYTWNAKELPRLLEHLDKHAVELSAIYFSPQLGDAVDPNFVKLLPLLKGRSTRLELAIRGSAKKASAEGDQQAEAMLREWSDLVADSGPIVSIYPHIGFYTASEEDGLRLVTKVDRKNVATHFNLYHSPNRLKLDQLEAFFKKALPHISCVTINGLDKGRIVPLDQGDLDVPAFLRMIERVGYRGPVGLQAWSVPGNSAMHLDRSMKKWRAWSGK